MIQIRDITDDERFYILGQFLSLDQANAAIDAYVSANNGAPPSSEQTDPEFGVVLELCSLPLGWADPKRRQVRSWEMTGVVDEGSQIEEWVECPPDEEELARPEPCDDLPRDYLTNPLRIGDRIQHPNGDTGTVVWLSPYVEPFRQWRVRYDNDDEYYPPLAWQVGQKGMAVKRGLAHLIEDKFLSV